MFGLCDSATIALIVCIIVSVIVFVIAMIIGYKLDDSMEFAIICGFLSMIVCFIVSLTVVMGIQNDDIQKELKSSLSKNYPGYTDLEECFVLTHNDMSHSFKYNGQNYFCKFEYYKDKTLTVYANDGALDGIYVDGKKQQTSTNEINGTMDDRTFATDDSRIDNDEIVLISKIQDKIYEKYEGSKITNFDVIEFTGAFTYKDIKYDFSWADDLLTVTNASDSSDVSYYKVEK